MPLFEDFADTTTTFFVAGRIKRSRYFAVEPQSIAQPLTVSANTEASVISPSPAPSVSGFTPTSEDGHQRSKRIRTATYKAMENRVMEEDIINLLMPLHASADSSSHATPNSSSSSSRPRQMPDPTQQSYAILIFDTEITSRSSTANIIQLAAKAFLPACSSSQVPPPFIRFVNQMPGGEQINRWASAVHGISQKSLTKAEHFKHVGPKFINWVDSLGAQVVLFVAHKSSFDEGRMLYEFKRIRRSWPEQWHWLDSLNIASSEVYSQKLELPSLTLEELAKYFGLPVKGHHHADVDIGLLEQVLKHLLFPSRPPAAVSNAELAERIWTFWHQMSAVQYQ